MVAGAGDEHTRIGAGGARKFNLPAIDRGGTEGWPRTGINSSVFLPVVVQ